MLCACLILPRSYKDNSPCVEMISGRVGDLKYLSMFSILDEQSSLPKCTDITLVDAYHKQFAAHPNYEKPRFGKESFIVKHFAGSVMCAVISSGTLQPHFGLIFNFRYETMGFLDKNRDEIRDDIMRVLYSSSNSFLKEILPEAEVAVVQAGQAKGKKRTTLASHFKNQLVDLMSVLDQTLPAYVRCIKPNPEKLPRRFSSKDVLGQMNCNNILETVRLRQQGWAVRRKFEFFYQKNWILDPSLGHPARMKGADHKARSAARQRSYA